MDQLMMSFYINTIPATWEKLAYFSLKSHINWRKDLLNTHKLLVDFPAELALPNTAWLQNISNPSSFLATVAQSGERKNGSSLDQHNTSFEVSKKMENEIVAAPYDGAFIHGLFFESAHWDLKTK